VAGRPLRAFTFKLGPSGVALGNLGGDVMVSGTITGALDVPEAVTIPRDDDAALSFLEVEE
jgi:hypothetical protein